MASYGERFAEFVFDYLNENELTNTLGQLSLGKINRKTLAELSDKFEKKERREDKKEQVLRLSKGELDKLFDALATGSGCDLKAMTEAEGKRCGIARSMIVRATPDVTVEEILEACKRYPVVFNGAVMTPMAIANNWSKLVDPHRGAQERRAPQQWWKQPTFDWHRVVALIWPREKFPDRQPWEEDSWDLVPSHIKKRIHAEGPAALEQAR